MIHRRRWLAQAAAAIAAPALARGERRSAPSSLRLAAPNLADDQVLRFVAGIRPYRKGGVRIERETVGSIALLIGSPERLHGSTQRRFGSGWNVRGER